MRHAIISPSSSTRRALPVGRRTRQPSAPFANNAAPDGASSTLRTNSSCDTSTSAPRKQQSSPANTQSSRRDCLKLLLLPAALQLAGSSSAQASERGMARYIRRKKLDPLETYVPLVLEAKGQLQASKDLAAGDATTARSLLRAGAFNGLRDNVRALGEYAVTNGITQDSAPLVTAFFRAVEQYDLLLAVAVRDSATPDAAQVEKCVQAALVALEELLATVPADVMVKAKAILAAASSMESESAAASPASAGLSDDDLKLLLSGAASK